MSLFRPLTRQRLIAALSYWQFDARLQVRHDPEASAILAKKYWEVQEPFKFYIAPAAQETWVYIPRGYLTDGASVPKPFWWLLPPWGRYGQAAVVHDWCCEYLSVYSKGLTKVITRKQADRIFLEAMQVAGVSMLVRYTMYLGVRAYAGYKFLFSKPDLSVYKAKQALERCRSAARSKSNIASS